MKNSPPQAKKFSGEIPPRDFLATGKITPQIFRRWENSPPRKIRCFYLWMGQEIKS